MENESTEAQAAAASKLQAIIPMPDGTRDVIYDGVQMSATAAPLTAAERAEVELVQYTPPPEPPVPEFVDDLQIRLGLNAAGLRDAVESAVAAGNQDLRDWWQRSKRFERQHPLVLGVADLVGVDSAGVDALFVLAATL